MLCCLHKSLYKKCPKNHLFAKHKKNNDKNIFIKSYKKNWSRKISLSDSVVKNDPWTIKIKGLSGEKVIGSFYKKK